MKFDGRALPLENWPESDRIAWQAATHNSGVLDASGPASHLAPVTRDDHTRRYGRFLGFIAHQGHLVIDGLPATNVTRENMSAYIAHLKDHVGSITVHGCVLKALKTAEWIAPERDWNWLRDIARQLAQERRPRDKRSSIVESARLYALGQSLMTQADQIRTRSPFKATTAYRDGLMVALLALCPLRLKNFAALALNTSIRPTGDGWVIAISHEDSKTRRPIEMLLPDILKSALARYLADYRTGFPGANNTDALWLSRSGGALAYNSVEAIIRRRTTMAFGHAVSPHLFRDCAATTVATHHGARMGVVIALLGHRDRRTIDKHYNHAAMATAVSNYQAILEHNKERH
jgi:site-specific recombinase XerD